MCVWPAADTSCLCRGAFDDANRMFFGISIAGGILLLVVVASTNQSDLELRRVTDGSRSPQKHTVTGGHGRTRPHRHLGAEDTPRPGGTPKDTPPTGFGTVPR